MLGDKKPVVMESDLDTPGGVATLGEDGKLSENQRPETTIAGVTGLEAALDEKAAKTVPAEAGNVATLDGDGNLQDSGVNLDSKQDKLTIEDEVTRESENPVKSSGIYAALQNVTIEMDDTPALDSPNAVRSGGVYAALRDLETQEISESAVEEMWNEWAAE